MPASRPSIAVLTAPDRQCLPAKTPSSLRRALRDDLPPARSLLACLASDACATVVRARFQTLGDDSTAPPSAIVGHSGPYHRQPVVPWGWTTRWVASASPKHGSRGGGVSLPFDDPMKHCENASDYLTNKARMSMSIRFTHNSHASAWVASLSLSDQSLITHVSLQIPAYHMSGQKALKGC